MKACLSYAVDIEKTNLHPDIAGGKDYYQQEKETLKKKSFNED